MPGRGVVSSTGYRYGFNGQQKDDEIKGSGNSYDFGSRIYDPRLGRWFSCDAKERDFPGISTYSFSFNNPVIFKDPDGKSGRLTVHENETGGGTITVETTIHLYGADPANVQRVVDASNKKFNEMNNSYSYIDSHGNEWKVEYKATFVANEGFKGLGNNPFKISESQAEAVPGFEAGDNWASVDPMPPGEADPSVMEEVRFNAAAGVGGGGTGTHVAWHFLNFMDRYTGSVERKNFFRGDVLGLPPIVNVNPINFINIAEDVVNPMTGTSTVPTDECQVIYGFTDYSGSVSGSQEKITEQQQRQDQKCSDDQCTDE